jgi:predicted secreted protein
MMLLINAASRKLSLTLGLIILLMIAAVIFVYLIYGMSVGGAIAFYFVIWWIMLFITLPIGVKSQNEAGDITPGTDPGAPSFPALRERAIWTSIIASIMLCASGIPIRMIFG